MPEPTTFDYHAFIKELRGLVEQAEAFDASDRRWDAEKFRRWRHELEDLITRIGRQRYMVNCKIGNRDFRAMRSVAPHETIAQ